MLTLLETASHLRVSVSLVRAEVARGKLRAVRIGRLLRVDPRDLEAYIATLRGGARSTVEGESIGCSGSTPAAAAKVATVVDTAQDNSARP